MKKEQLNKTKREAYKKAFKQVVSQTPSQEKEDLLKCQTYFREARTTLHDLTVKLVEKRYPKEDLEVLRKYNNQSSGYHGRNFTDMDRCFVYKNTNSDDPEVRATFDLKLEVAEALNHDSLSAQGLNPFNSIWGNEVKSNPHYHNQEGKNSNWLRENTSDLGSGYADRESLNMNTWGIEIVNTGGCHTRAYALEQDYKWAYVVNYKRCTDDLIMSHENLYKFEKEMLTIMNAVIDNARVVDDIREVWKDVDDYISLNDINSNTGNALSLVSDDAKQKIEQLLNRNKADKDHIVVVNKSQLTS
jgi:hypothetical protein|tara:strand:- start:516 stop:1421 length:906 start_codon:yes stop_codon:yes gene_type:complete